MAKNILFYKEKKNMDKMKVLAVAKETVKNTYNGVTTEVLEVYLGEERQKVDGYVPVIAKIGISRKGNAYAIAPYQVGTELLANYYPVVGDEVNVSFDRWGNLVNIVKAQ